MRLYFSWTGSIPRRTYWLGFLRLLLPIGALQFAGLLILDWGQAPPDLPPGLYLWISGLQLALGLLQVPLLVKRLAQVGRDPRLVVGIFVPVIIFGWLRSQWWFLGWWTDLDAPGFWFTVIVALCFSLVAAWLSLEAGFRRGNAQPKIGAAKQRVKERLWPRFVGLGLLWVCASLPVQAALYWNQWTRIPPADRILVQGEFEAMPADASGFESARIAHALVQVPGVAQSIGTFRPSGFQFELTLDSEADTDAIAIAVRTALELTPLESGLAINPGSLQVLRRIPGRSRSLVLVGDLSMEQFSQLAFRLRDDLQAGLAVAVEAVEGAWDLRVEVLPNPDRLAACNISPLELNAALADALGTLEPSGQKHTLPDIESLARIVVSANDSLVLRLEDVARIQTAAFTNERMLLDGQACVSLALTLEAGGTWSEVLSLVNARLPDEVEATLFDELQPGSLLRIHAELPEGTRPNEVYSQAKNLAAQFQSADQIEDCLVRVPHDGSPNWFSCSVRARETDGQLRAEMAKDLRALPGLRADVAWIYPDAPESVCVLVLEALDMAAIASAFEDLHGRTESLPGLWVSELFIPRIGNEEMRRDWVQIGNWPVYVRARGDESMGKLTILDTLRSRQESTDFDSQATSGSALKADFDTVPYFGQHPAASMRLVLDPAQDHDQLSQDLLELTSVLQKNHPEVTFRLIRGPISFE